MRCVATSPPRRHSLIATIARSFAVATLLAHGACSGQGPATRSPVAPAALRPAEEIAGYVNDTAFQPVPNARVEVLDGPESGTTTITDASGRFSLEGEFTATTRFRAAKDGYEAAVQTLQPSTTIPSASRSLTFFMSVAGASGNHATLTVEADGACSDLPSSVRVRTYPATVTAGAFPLLPANTAFFATLSGASLDGYFHVVFIRVEGARITFDLSDNGIEEEVAPETYYFVGGVGGARTQPGATSISGPFSGVVDYCTLKTDPGTLYPCSDQAITRVRCASANHRMSLTWQ